MCLHDLLTEMVKNIDHKALSHGLYHNHHEKDKDKKIINTCFPTQLKTLVKA